MLVAVYTTYYSLFVLPWPLFICGTDGPFYGLALSKDTFIGHFLLHIQWSLACSSECIHIKLEDIWPLSLESAN